MVPIMLSAEMPSQRFVESARPQDMEAKPSAPFRMCHDTPEFSLIAGALTGNPGLPPCPDWDWDQTVAIAAREEVLPTLAGKLSCPPGLSDFFEAIHELNAKRNRQLIGEIETLALLSTKPESSRCCSRDRPIW